MSIPDFWQKELDEREAAGLKRSLRVMTSAQGRVVEVEGQTLINFCSNNYLGLANDPRVIEAARQSLDQDGFGSGASRLVCGHMNAHERLEQRLAQIKKTDACLLFSTGYMANVGVLQAVCGRDDVIIQDKWNHASLIDGAILSRAEVKRYAHKDMAALERILQPSMDKRQRLIVTDSVFSMDGDVAPLADIVRLAKKYDAMVMVDEAHAFGLLGEHGSGLVEALGLQTDVDIQMGTLSKAAGCFGAYVCGSQTLIDKLIHDARSFVYTTGMPPSTAAAALKAVEIIAMDAETRARVNQLADYVRTQLQSDGWNTLESETTIIPVVIGEAHKAVELADTLRSEGFWVQAIRPPTVPQGTSRLRITITAEHARDDVDALIHAMKNMSAKPYAV